MDVPNLDGATILSAHAQRRLLGFHRAVPLTPNEMARSLRVAFYPAQRTVKLTQFLENLGATFRELGVEMLTYEQALAEGANGRIAKGITLIAPGEGNSGDLAIDHVASLSQNTVVGVIDGTMPRLDANRFEKRVQALVSALTWHMVHVIIYVDDISWTVCNMNGAIETFSLDQIEERVFQSLVPKLAAPVVPPQKSDFELEEQAFDTHASAYEVHIRDMLYGVQEWGRTGLLATPSKLTELAFRNSRYRHIANAYLSWRTGMSYGSLARQLPVNVRPALTLAEAPPVLRDHHWDAEDLCECDGEFFVALRLGGDEPLLVQIPEVSALCTRSGCDKTAVVPQKDLIQLTLRSGRVIVRTPVTSEPGADCQPSFDTATILAHAVGNAVVASVLAKLRPGCSLSHTIKKYGLALAHWHGYIQDDALPLGYFLHGRENPPVSCSTAQAALFALTGKLIALQQSLTGGVDYLGDAHIEPSHGTNITGRSLSELARLVASATQSFN